MDVGEQRRTKQSQPVQSRLSLRRNAGHWLATAESFKVPSNSSESRPSIASINLIETPLVRQCHGVFYGFCIIRSPSKTSEFYDLNPDELIIPASDRMCAYLKGEYRYLPTLGTYRRKRWVPIWKENIGTYLTIEGLQQLNYNRTSHPLWERLREVSLILIVKLDDWTNFLKFTC